MLCNNGPLVEPITRTTYQNGTGKKPLQLFSHSDQVGLFQTAIANSVSQTGWGGRLADKTSSLNGIATFPSNVSIAGVNLFLTGVDTRQLAVADSNTSLANVLVLSNAPGATTAEINSRLASFNETADLRSKLQTYQGSQRHAYQCDSNRQRFGYRESDTGDGISKYRHSVRQLLQVARLIKASTDPSAGINMKRQIFFVQIGGFDTHSAQLNSQATLLTQVSQAINAFYLATVDDLNLADKVTLVHDVRFWSHASACGIRHRCRRQRSRLGKSSVHRWRSSAGTHLVRQLTRRSC